MDRDKYISFCFLTIIVGVFAFSQTFQTALGLLIAAVTWILTIFLPRICPIDKPTALQADIKKLNDTVKLLDETVLRNAEFSAKEFGSIKTAMQIKQLGR